MPANKKYLTQSGWIRLSKILSGVIGGYLVSLTFHIALSRFFPLENLMVTSFITAYLLWAILLLLAFLIKKSWKTWIIYTFLIALFWGIYTIPIN